MELKVWVEGIQRIVCGVTVNTTCQDVVFALAHATGKVGRFTLIERWRNNERLLAPNENPLKLLLKWGEYANDVQFILQRSEQNAQKAQQQQQQQQQQHAQQHQLQLAEATSSNNHINNDKNFQTNTVMKKPLGFSNNNNNNLNNNNNNNNNNNTNTTNTSNNNNNNNFVDSSKNSTTTQHKRQQSDDNVTSKELRKSFGAHDAKQSENVGIVKGVPQRLNTNRPQPTSVTTNFTHSPQQRISPQIILPKHEKSHSNPIQMPNTQSPNNNYNNHNNNNNENNINNLYAQIGPKSKSTNAINLAEVRNALDRGTAAGSPEIMFTTNTSSNENLLDIFNGNFNTNNNNNSNNTMEQQQPYNNNVTPTISANGALVPPPYRDPPPPRNSPLQPYKSMSNSSDHSTCQNSPACQNCNGSMMHEIAAHSAGVCSNPFLNDYNDFDLDLQGGGSGVGCEGMAEESESIFQATQYNDLLTLIKFQREKITLQQSELSKYDAEIVYLESKERDQAQELEAISREITKADQIFRQGSEQLQTLQYVEEENELVKQQEKTLKSEIALLRSKLANCETELLQCKNKIRILMDDIEVEQRAISNKQKSNRQNVERDFLIEMERIQSEIDQAIHNTDTSNKTTENLKKEILLIENAIAEKKRQVEKLVNEMKEVNLQSLTVTTSEEIKHLLEGSNKPGSSRRIIGSPRQLENAVPTSKNPHGVWV